jgi:hypothetical protein
MAAMSRALVVLGLAVILLLALELAVPARGHRPPGTSAALGLVGCAVIVGIAKGLGRLGLQRPEIADE